MKVQHRDHRALNLPRCRHLLFLRIRLNVISVIAEVSLDFFVSSCKGVI